MIKGTFESKKVTIDGVELNPEESQKLINHSPDGFNWGYAGSGPAQLALALLMFFTTKHNALKYHQAIKTDIIQNLPQEDFELPVLEIKNWIALNIPRD